MPFRHHDYDTYHIPQLTVSELVPQLLEKPTAILIFFKTTPLTNLTISLVEAVIRDRPDVQTPCAGHLCQYYIFLVFSHSRIITVTWLLQALGQQEAPQRWKAGPKQSRSYNNMTYYIHYGNSERRPSLKILRPYHTCFSLAGSQLHSMIMICGKFCSMRAAEHATLHLSLERTDIVGTPQTQNFFFSLSSGPQGPTPIQSPPSPKSKQY
jgi:hypothetical protein